MNAISKPIRNFEEWTLDYYSRGGIRVIGDDETGYELAITNETMEAAYVWLASRYDEKKGEQCIAFVIDGILDMDWSPDGYAAKLLVSALNASDPATLITTMRMIRHNYCQKAIEHFKGTLVDRFKSGKKPDPSQARKDRLESEASVKRYAYPKL